MLDKMILETKKALYLNQIQELREKDISAEVDLKLAAERARLEEEIRKEVEADILKCQNYLELLDKLIEEANEVEETPVEETEEIAAEEPAPIDEEPTGFTDSSVNTDVFQVR